LLQLIILMGATVGLGLVAIVVGLLWQILRQQGRILLRLDDFELRLGVARSSDVVPGGPSTSAAPAGLPVGSVAPGFSLERLHGGALTLDTLLAGNKPVLLLFTDPKCGPCQLLIPDIARWQREHARMLTIALISEGSAHDNRAKSSEHGVTEVLLQKTREVAEIYLAYGTPGAVLIRKDGTVGSPLALGADEVRALVTRILRMELPAPLPVATIERGNGSRPDAGLAYLRSKPIPLQAPDFKLPDLDGRMVRLSQFRGRQTLVLFWNPSCGFCQQMLANLRAWEAARSAHAPSLVVISSGTVEDNRALGPRAPVLLDQTLQTASAFGAHGTPMAVLVDDVGRVAAELAAGAEAVLALAARQSPTDRSARFDLKG
jgi:peroxiredoxin